MIYISDIVIPILVRKGEGNGKHKKNGKGQKGTTVFLDESEHEAAKRFAAASGISLAELMRVAVAQYLKSQAKRKAVGAMRERGSGSVFRKPGTRFWWIAYSFRGHSHQESSGSTDRKVALKLLKDRLGKIDKPNFVESPRRRGGGR